MANTLKYAAIAAHLLTNRCWLDMATYDKNASSMWLITVLENDGNNVETRSHILLVSGDISIGHGYQHPLFSFRHGQIGLTVFAAPACLYLYKEQKLAVLGNNVDFLMGYCANCVPKSRSPSLSSS